MLRKLLAWAALSAVATVAVVHSAVSTRHQFYPTVIFLVTNKTSLLVLCNQAVVFVVALAYIVKTLFLGPLKPTEVERVNETLRYSIPEICIALTVFREELSLRIGGLFLMLLFSKFFHVLLDERVNDVSASAPSR